MAIRTSSNFREFVTGAPHEWFMHRTKAGLANAPCPVVDIGTATDTGTDVVMGAIPTTVIGAAGVCELPTGQVFSACTGRMTFTFHMTGVAPLPTLTVTVWAGVRGDSGGIEDWQRLTGPCAGIADGESLVVDTNGQEVFVHIDSIQNPNGDTSLEVRAIAGTAFSGGIGLVSEDEMAGTATYGWYAAANGWARIGATVGGELMVSDDDALAALTVIANAMVAAGTGIGYLNTMTMLNALGKIGIYFSPVHFDAAYTGPHALTLTIPAELYDPAVEQFVGVVEYRAGNTHVYHRENSDWAYAANILTVTDHDGGVFGATSRFVVIFAERQAAIEVHDAAPRQGYVNAMGAQGYAGIPPAEDDADMVRLWARINRALVVAQSEGSDRTTSSVTNWEQPPTGATHGTRDCTNVNTGYPIVAASTPCVAVFLTAAEANAGICIWGGTGITTAGAGISKASQAPSYLIPIDDAAKIYVASSNAGDDVNFAILTR